MSTLQELALGYLQGGLSLLPCDEKTKRPRPDLLPVDESGKASWKPYQTTPPTVETVRSWFARGCKSIGAVCGPVSGNLEVIDDDEASLYPVLCEEAGELLDGLAVQKTGRGFQIAYRTANVEPNSKLAWVPDDEADSGRRIGIETRGTGGYVCLPGSLHPSGNVYQAIAGDWSAIPTISQARADAIKEACRKLDRCPLTRQQRDAAEQRAKLEAEERAERNGEGSVIDLFNERNPIRATLERFGYKKAGLRYHRPGAPAGLPASVVIFDDGRSFHHDSDDALSDGHAHRPFDVFCQFEHGGDVSKAVKSAAEALGVAYKQNGEKTAGSCDKTLTKPGVQRVLSIVTQVEEWKTFPCEALPEPLGDFVLAAGEALGCDPSMIGVPLLACLGGAVGSTTWLELKESWREPAITWAAIVAESGSLKSPGQDVAVGPLHRAQAKAMAALPEQHETYKRDLACWEADMGEWKKSGRKKGEQPPERPEEPRPWRCLVKDTTPEALADRLQYNTRGLLCAPDELCQWLDAIGQYKSGGRSGDASHWLSMFRAGPLCIDRKTGQKTIYIPMAGVSVVGGIQPRVLARALGGEYFANGLASRLLLCMPPRQPKRWTERTIDRRLQQQVDLIFSRLLGLGYHVNEADQEEPVVLGMSPEGKKAWVRFYNEFGEEQNALVGNEAAAASKLEGYAARLSLIVHLCRVCAEDPSVDTELVDNQSVASGVALTRWFQNEARRVYSVLSETDEETEQRQLVELIRRHGNKISPRELQRARRLATSEEAESLLGELVKQGLCKREPLPSTPQGGRPSFFYSLSPVTKDKTPSTSGVAGVMSHDPDEMDP